MGSVNNMPARSLDEFRNGDDGKNRGAKAQNGRATAQASAIFIP
jgi:hypothetical protein